MPYYGLCVVVVAVVVPAVPPEIGLVEACVYGAVIFVPGVAERARRDQTSPGKIGANGLSRPCIGGGNSTVKSSKRRNGSLVSNEWSRFILFMLWRMRNNSSAFWLVDGLLLAVAD